MSQKKTTTKGGTKGKAGGSKGEKGQAVTLDLTMGKRVRFVVTDSGVKQSVKDGLDKLFAKLAELVEASAVPDIPEAYIVEYEALARAYRSEERQGTLTDEAREAAAELAAYVERHEPESHRLARRVSELLNSDADGRDEAVEWFLQLTNDAGVSLMNPEFCAAAFVMAARRVEAAKPVRRATRANIFQRNAQTAYERLKEIVRRVDAGESLAQIRDEGGR